MNNRSTIGRPQRVFNAWLILTMFLFYFGPLRYNCDKNLSMIYMIAFIAVANGFYYLGGHVKTRIPRKHLSFDCDKIIDITLKYSLILTFLYLLEAIFRYGFKSFSFTSIISQMANTYTEAEAYRFMVSAWILSYTKWIRVIALVLGSLHWNRLKKSQKIMYGSLCLLIVIHNTLYVGSQKELIDLVVYVVVPILMRWIKENRHLGLKKKIIAIVGVIAFSIFLGSVIAGRRELWAQLYNSNTGIGADPNNWIYKILPTSISSSITYLLSYVTQGYRGLSLCLTLPFQWTYGVGSSFKFMNDISRWFSIPLDVLEKSYPVRMQQAYGVGAYASWHTIFPWIASDFTFFGAIFIVSIFVYYWAKSWREVISSDSWIAPVMFSHLTILILFIPCNNQLFQTRDSIVASLVIFALWYFYHGIDATNYSEKG